tara:strand:+ start:29 stop:505 length:477 start_codon:yes stop_codon:yes gene_type:complete
MGTDEIKLSLKVNGSLETFVCKQFSTLLDALREGLGLLGSKYGCGIGYCGACTVLVDGNSAHACCLLAETMQGREIQTIENTENDQIVEKIQDYFLSEGAVQCGYCIPGIIMTIRGLVESSTERVTEDSLREHLNGNICRCSGFASIVRAGLKACNYE